MGALTIECSPMANDSGAEKPSTLSQVVARNKRVLWRAVVGVALIVTAVALIVVL